MSDEADRIAFLKAKTAELNRAGLDGGLFVKIPDGHAYSGEAGQIVEDLYPFVSIRPAGRLTLVTMMKSEILSQLPHRQS